MKPAYRSRLSFNRLERLKIECFLIIRQEREQGYNADVVSNDEVIVSEIGSSSCSWLTPRCSSVSLHNQNLSPGRSTKSLLCGTDAMQRIPQYRDLTEDPK